MKRLTKNIPIKIELEVTDEEAEKITSGFGDIEFSLNLQRALYKTILDQMRDHFGDDFVQGLQLDLQN